MKLFIKEETKTCPVSGCNHPSTLFSNVPEKGPSAPVYMEETPFIWCMRAFTRLLCETLSGMDFKANKAKL